MIFCVFHPGRSDLRNEKLSPRRGVNGWRTGFPGEPGPTKRAPSYRRGSLLTELIICTFLLSVLAAVLVPGVFAVVRQRQATQFAVLAQMELDNTATRLQSDLSVDIDQLELSEWFTERYPRAVLKIENAAVEQNEASGEIADDLVPARIIISRPTQKHLPEESLSLVTWYQKPTNT